MMILNFIRYEKIIHLDIENEAFFAMLEYDVSDNLSLSAEGRFYDEEERDGRPSQEGTQRKEILETLLRPPQRIPHVLRPSELQLSIVCTE